jgi:uncharacterized protein YeaO (DUF488 family)
MRSFHCTSTFRAEVRIHGDSLEDRDSAVASIAPNKKLFAGMHCESHFWLPTLAPAPELLHRFTCGSLDWYDFARIYSQELQRQVLLCQQLRSIACRHRLLFLSDAPDPQKSVESAFVNHLERLECENRWDAGLMIGGFVFPVRQQIEQAGGLWFACHKAWVMPDRRSWEYIQSLLPGDI